MVKITLIEFNGAEHTIDAKPGVSIMENAVKHGVPGIDADCGGACACATCQVYVQEPWAPVTGEASPMELEMLDTAPTTQANSRLSCQIEVTAAMDGLVLRLPESQH